MNEFALHRSLMNSPVSQVRAFTSIASTNDEALQWIDEGAPDFALVIADEQTKGRGRLDRPWITMPEASLAFSIIFRPTQSELAAPSALYAPLCGLAVWHTLHENLGLDPKIKWPNDILLEQQKCCGILVEASWTGSQFNGVVMGIGINITAQSIPSDAVLRFPATWLEKYTRQPVDRFALLAQITSAMQFWRSRMGSREFFETWQTHLAFRGETVSIVQNEKTSIIGIEEGIDALGNLVLREPSGKKTTIEVGDVSLRLRDEKK
jgi:BirA family transcriptional regulator, biotin operon repressor / biotin---[acetyl-CoA-carboxylase] ligase